MHVQDRPTPAVPALAPTMYRSGAFTAAPADTTMTGAPIPEREGLQGEFELEVE